MDIATLGLEVKSTQVKNASKALNTLYTDATKAELSAKNLKKGMGNLETKMQNLAKTAAAALTGFTLASYAKQAVLAAARYETLGIVMEVAGKNAGYASYEMAAFEEQIRKNGIAMQESRSVLTSLATANIDLAKATELSRVAQDVAVVGGLNSSDTFRRLVHGIRAAEVEILRTIGLNVTFQDGYKKLAAQLGVNEDALTSQQKMMSRVNIVLEEGAKYFGIYEASMQTAGKQMLSLQRYFSDISTIIGEVGLDAFSIGIMSVMDSAKETQAALEEMRASGELSDMSKSLGEGFGFIVSNLDTAIVSFGTWLTLTKLAQTEIGKLAISAVNSGGGLTTLKNSISIVTTATYERLAAEELLARQQMESIQLQHQASIANIQALKSRQDFTASIMGQVGASKLLAQAEAQEMALRNSLTAATQRASLATQTLTKSSTLAALTFGKMKTAASGFIGLLGGPWIAGFALLAGSVWALNEAFEDQDRHIKDTQDAYDDLIAKLDGAAQATENLTEKQRQFELLKLGRAVAETTEEYNSLRTVMTSVLQDIPDDSRVLGSLKSIQDTTLAVLDSNVSLEEKAKTVREALAEIGLATNSYNSSLAQTMTTDFQNLLIILDKVNTTQQRITQVETGITPPKKNEGGDDPPLSPSSVSSIESARKSLASLNVEIEEMYGRDTSALELDQKLVEIAKNAKIAGENVSDFQNRYIEAFETKRANERFKEIQNIEKEIATLLGNDSVVKSIELAQSLDEMSKSFTSLGVPLAQQTDLMQRFVEATNQAQEFSDLEVASEFMKDLADLSGAHGLAIEYQNSVLMQQAEIYRQTLPESLRHFVDEWEKLQKLETSRDFTAGLKRGFTEWTSNASDAAANMESLVTNSFDSMASSLADFATSGSFDFRSLADSIIADLARISTQMLISEALQSIFGLMDGGGGGKTATSSSLSSGSSNWSGWASTATSAFKMFSFASGGVAGAVGLNSGGGVLTSPTHFYNTGSHQKTFSSGGPAVAGEAGPEVFMPAKRLSNGDYGVAVSLGQGGGSNVVVNQTFNITANGSGSQSDQETGNYENMAKMIKQYTQQGVYEVLQKEQQPGGMLRGRA